MARLWTEQHVLSLVSDAGVARDGEKLAKPARWLSLGCDERAAWGEHQGSGAEPYKTQIELDEPAFKCTCPSRKFPCKHAVGLFLLLAKQPDAFARTEPPVWVNDWLAARAKKAAAKKVESLPDPEVQSARAAARDAKVAAGLEELELWLHDLVRSGLGAEQVRNYEYWDRIAARMVDAQAPGIARILRKMAGLPYTGNDWVERMLDYAGRLFLLVESYKRLETLPQAVQADVRAIIGWSQKQEEITTQAGLRDEWLVVYSDMEIEDRLRTRRAMLIGRNTQQTALLLDFAFGKATFETFYAVGTHMDAEVVFYPSAYPLRAVIKQRHRVLSDPINIEDFRASTIDEALREYAHALSVNPWIERLPVALREVVPYREDERWSLRSGQTTLPIAKEFALRANPWWLLALSGGHPIWMFGDWNGYEFLPLGGWSSEDGWR
jgi:hypothetical protein